MFLPTFLYDLWQFSCALHSDFNRLSGPVLIALTFLPGFPSDAINIWSVCYAKVKSDILVCFIMMTYLYCMIYYIVFSNKKTFFVMQPSYYQKKKQFTIMQWKIGTVGTLITLMTVLSCQTSFFMC